MSDRIITRPEFIAAMARQKLDRMGLIEPSQDDATVIALFAQRILPLIVQAEALFWENGGIVNTPKQASLALALHQIEPQLFAFADCACGKYVHLTGCAEKVGQSCGRRAWLDALRARTALPSNLQTAPITAPARGNP